jgi:hypothetical protein
VEKDFVDVLVDSTCFVSVIIISTVQLPCSAAVGVADRLHCGEGSASHTDQAHIVSPRTQTPARESKSALVRIAIEGISDASRNTARYRWHLYSPKISALHQSNDFLPNPFGGRLLLISLSSFHLRILIFVVVLLHPVHTASSASHPGCPSLAADRQAACLQMASNHAQSHHNPELFAEEEAFHEGGQAAATRAVSSCAQQDEILSALSSGRQEDNLADVFCELSGGDSGVWGQESQRVSGLDSMDALRGGGRGSAIKRRMVEQKKERYVGLSFQGSLQKYIHVLFFGSRTYVQSPSATYTHEHTNTARSISRLKHQPRSKVARIARPKEAKAMPHHPLA